MTLLWDASGANPELEGPGPCDPQNLGHCRFCFQACRSKPGLPRGAHPHQFLELPLIEGNSHAKIVPLQGIWSRFFPVYDQLRADLKANAYGNVQFLSINFGALLWNKAPRVMENVHGGGSLFTLGVYPIQLALLIFNEEPERIEADAVIAQPNSTQNKESPRDLEPSLPYPWRQNVVSNLKVWFFLPNGTTPDPGRACAPSEAVLRARPFTLGRHCT